MSVILEYLPGHVLFPCCSEGVLEAWLLDWDSDHVGAEAQLGYRCP